MDDSFGTASCSRTDLELFIKFVNDFHPVLNFTWEISETSVLLLEILVFIYSNALATSVLQAD